MDFSGSPLVVFFVDKAYPIFLQARHKGGGTCQPRCDLIVGVAPIPDPVMGVEVTWQESETLEVSVLTDFIGSVDFSVSPRFFCKPCPIFLSAR